MACESTKTYMNHSNDHSEGKNLDAATIASFGDEWSRFDQSALSAKEAQQIFDEYFAIFPWHQLPSGATGFDMGYGSGRWAKIMARKVDHLHCIDSSSVLAVAKKALRERKTLLSIRRQLMIPRCRRALRILDTHWVFSTTYQIRGRPFEHVSACSSQARLS